VSFHVIGTIFDRVYNAGSSTSPPLTSVQTISVAPGGAMAVELTGRFVLVDHALARMERGLVGALLVEGPANPDIFRAGDGSALAVPMKH
jgi:nitrite reductase (NO-forming)